jgi:hypothetical protein
MVLLGDVGQVKARFGPFRDILNLSARWVHGLCQMFHDMKVILGTLGGTPWGRVSSGSLFRFIWRVLV